MATSKTGLARVLVDFVLFGVALKCNQIVETDADVIKQHVKSGELDSSTAAVKYCQDELFQKPIVIDRQLTAAEILEEKKSDLAKKIEAAEANFKAAAEADRPAAQKVLEDLKAELFELG